MTILLLTIVLMKWRRWKARRQLKWQQALASTGIGLRTEVLDVKKKGQPLNGHVKICLLIRLRVKGKIVSRRVYTLLKGEQFLQAGDRVHIRYNPCHVNQVLLCRDNHQ